MNWKPMSEAPRDGRAVLCWIKNLAFAEICAWDQDHKTWRSEQGYWDDADFTHWAPIEPPSAE